MEKSNMQSSFQSGHNPSNPSRVVELSLDVNQIPRGRRNPKTEKDIEHQVQVKQRANYPEKLKGKDRAVQPCIDVQSDLLKPVNSERSNYAKTLRKSQQGAVKARSPSEELVRYMSNVPGFLQRTEKGENMQDNALNVGVLDWGRLEKWKGNQQCAAQNSNDQMPSNGKSKVRVPTFPNLDRDEISAYHNKQLPSRHKMGQTDGSSKSPGTSVHKFTRSQDFESTRCNVDGQKIRGWHHKPFGRNSIDVVTHKGIRKGLDKKVSSKVWTSSLDSASSASHRELPENFIAFAGDAGRHQAMKNSDKKVAPVCISSSSFTASSSELKECDVSFLSKDKKSGSNKVKNIAEEASRNSTTLVSPEGKHGEKVILLVPKKSSQGSFSEEPRALASGSGKNADLRGISKDYSHEHRSSLISSDNPRLFPRPPRLETNKLVHRDNMMAAKDGELSSVVPRTGLSSGKHICSRSLDNFKVANQYDSETQNVMDEDIADQVVRKDRYPSPSRGLPFSLGRLTRSFSLKESSTTPQLSSGYESVKSGPVTSQSCAGLGIPKGEKTSGASRAKASPLRRLLDPLFKSKALSSSRASEREKSMKETTSSVDLERMNGIEIVQSNKQEGESIQAILHVTVKNGLPVFKFLVDKVDGKTSILAATKNISSPRKSNSGCSYTFYRIEEMKKRSGSWISPSSKDKRCNYTYNMIGQMNVNHSPFLGLTGEKLTGHETVSEYVLFGLEVGKKGETSPKLRPSRELGAVIVRTHNVNVGLQKQGDVDDNVAEKVWSQIPSDKGCCYWYSGESEESSSVTVILPAAVHGLPEKGGPWPLIQRWRSGGLCDCGGWDVGCGVCVLSAAVQVTSNDFQLSAEGGGSKGGKPVFVMRPAEKGMYSIEFSGRMSMIQAFFISMVVVQSLKPSDLVDLTMEKVLEEEASSYGNEPTGKMCGQDSGKFAPSPPLSPVGRV